MDSNAQKDDYKVETAIPAKQRDLIGPAIQMTMVKKEGYMNKPKGLKQILDVSQIQELFHSCGHIVGFTPKFHPEVVGCGIKYC
eukprot:4810353-Ditylum_brightwellii.AAC.1